LFILTEKFLVLPNPERIIGPITIDLDPRYYQMIDQFEARFPADLPDLLACERLEVKGDIKFSAGLTFQGKVKLINESEYQATLTSSERIQGAINF
jgi:UTP--glucose-1-phosphate uridylyltransferase